MKFLSKPLTLLMFLSFTGFIFFASLVILVTVYYRDCKDYLREKYEANLDDMKILIAIAGIHSIAFLLVTFQLFIAKPTSFKIMIPILLVTITAFILLIAIDLFIEYHLMHVTPKEQYKSNEKRSKDEGDGKKKGKGFKMGFFIIYVNMCIVTWFLYLAYKDLEEEIEKQEYENQPMEIVISHIT